MAKRTLLDFNITSAVIEFDKGKLVPCLQANLTCDDVIADRDWIDGVLLTKEMVPNKLCCCGFSVRKNLVNDIFPEGCITESGIIYSAIYHGSNIQYRSYYSSYGRGSNSCHIVSLELYVGTNKTNYIRNDISYATDGTTLSVGPVFIFYDTVGQRYFGLSVGGLTEAWANNVEVNVYGIIKANSNPQYVINNSELWVFGRAEQWRAEYNEAADAFLQNAVFSYDKYSPYDNLEPTVPEDGPGTGDWALPTDLVTEGGSPYSDLEAGLYRVYAMTASQVSSFSDQLWNADILDIISRYFERPQDVVISLKSFPFDITHGNDEPIEFRWISQWSTVNVTGGPVTQEMQVLDFGSKYVPRYSGLFFDYQPYSSLQLHLPYIGFVPLKMNEVIGKTLRVKYYVNVVSGDFTAHVMTDGNPLKNIGYYQGTIARELPLSSDDMFALVKKGAEIAAGAIMATGYGVAGAVESAAAQRIGGDIVQEVSNGNSQATESPQFAMAVTHEEKADYYTTEFKRHASHAIGNALQSIGSVNAPIARSGNLDGMNGRTSSQEVFYIMSVPHPNVPSNQQILGYPANLAGPLKNYTGYTTVREIRLSSAIATSSELAELEGILRGGIVI